jgi:hypothetical protein
MKSAEELESSSFPDKSQFEKLENSRNIQKTINY